MEFFGVLAACGMVSFSAWQMQRAFASKDEAWEQVRRHRGAWHRLRDDVMFREHWTQPAIDEVLDLIDSRNPDNGETE